MPRGPRLIPENGIFHITIRGNNKRRIFYKEREFRYFKDLILRYKKKFKFLLYHYALMKNHIHFCIHATEKTNISKMMQGLQLAYFHYHRKRYKYVGHLYQGRFKSKVIETDEYLLACGLYIEKNPVESNVVNDPVNYPWSSYRYYVLGEKDPLVDPSPIYNELGKYAEERKARYKELMKLRLEEARATKEMQLVVH